MDIINDPQIVSLEIETIPGIESLQVLGQIGQLVPKNEEEELNAAYFAFTRSKTTDLNVANKHTLKNRTRATTYYVGNMRILQIIKNRIGYKPEALGRLPRPILGDETIYPIKNFMEKLKKTLDLNVFKQFGHVRSDDQYTIENLVKIPDFSNTANHYGIFADTGAGKSSLAVLLLKKLIFNSNIDSGLVIDPKMQIYKEKLVSSKNFLKEAKKSGRKVYNLSIFDDIYFDLEIDALIEVGRALRLINRKILSIGNQKIPIFIEKFLELLLKENKEWINSSEENLKKVIINILKEFEDPSIASEIYTDVSSPTARDNFIEKIKDLINDQSKIHLIFLNLKRLRPFFRENEDNWSIEEVAEEVINIEKENKSIIFLNSTCSYELPDFITERLLHFVLSKLLEEIKNLLANPKLEKTRSFIFADEANYYFPSADEDPNKYQEESISYLREILNHWGRSKGFGILLACPDPYQLDAKILSRIWKKSLFLGFGLSNKVAKDIKERISPQAYIDYTHMDMPVQDDTGLMKSCQFLSVGIPSAIDPRGEGMVIEFDEREFDEEV